MEVRKRLRSPNLTPTRASHMCKTLRRAAPGLLTNDDGKSQHIHVASMLNCTKCDYRGVGGGLLSPAGLVTFSSFLFSGTKFAGVGEPTYWKYFHKAWI